MNFLVKKKDDVFNYNELSKKFLDYIDVLDKTIELYEKALRQFGLYLIDNNIKKPTREDVINWRESSKEYLKYNTVNSYLIAIRSFFKYLSYEGIYKNITENVKGIKVEKRHLKLGLSEEEIQKVLGVCKNDKEVLLIKMMINLGLRSNEVINIQIKDFYKDTETVMLKVLGKCRDGEKQDSIKVDGRLFNCIKEYIEKHNITNYLFTSDSDRNKGQQITTRTVRRVVKDIFERAELDNIELKSAHSLRHTTVDLLLKEGKPLEEVSEYSRHRSVTTTMIYKNEFDQKESECSNILASKLF